MKEYEFHEIADCLPLLTVAEISALATNIKTHGLLEPITLYERKILDGRNRYLACNIAGVEPAVITYDGDSPAEFVVGKNLTRRHLTVPQRAVAAAKLANLRHGGNRIVKESSKMPQGILVQTADEKEETSIASAAKIWDVSKRSVARAKKLLQNGEPALVSAVESGTISLKPALKLLEIPGEKQEKALKEITGGKKPLEILKNTEYFPVLLPIPKTRIEVKKELTKEILAKVYSFLKETKEKYGVELSESDIKDGIAQAHSQLKIEAKVEQMHGV